MTTGDTTFGAPTTATDLAASALLGALLWDPRRVHDVSGWLEPADFAHGPHRAIYQTLTGLIAHGRPVDLSSLSQVLARGEYHDLHVGRDGPGPLSAPALHALLSMTPATPRPDDLAGYEAGSEHVRYARVVLEDSIRREVHDAGTRIDQHARHVTGQDGEFAADAMVPVLAATAARLGELTGRLADSGEVRARTAAARNPPTTTAAAEAGPGAGREVGDARDPLTVAGVKWAEYSLIGACMAAPVVRQLVGDRLRAEDFLTAEVSATWQAIRGLSRRGEPVDVVLVAVEIERRGATADFGAGIGAAGLARLTARGDLASGYRAADTVVRAALARTVDHARGELRRLAGDRTRSGQEVLRGARDALTATETTARRLGGNAPAAAAAAVAPPTGRVPRPRHRDTTPPARPRPVPVPQSRPRQVIARPPGG